MKKHELIGATADLCEKPQALVRQVLDAAAEAARQAVARGDDVFLFGLGKLSVRQRGAKKARDLHTGETVVVPPRKVVLFRASDSLAGAANGTAD